MNVEKIENLGEILPLGEDMIILDQKISPLTTAGENYGSLMLGVDITVSTQDDIEKIHVVAKMVPPNEFIQEVFNTKVTFKNEIGFYDSIVPALRDFQREQGMERLIEFFPKYYGSRINSNGDSDEVDSDAVLLLENLKLLGYKNLDRTAGFDLDTSKLLLSDLAHLHAVPIALKLKKPEVFEAEVKKYLTPPSKHFVEKFLTELMPVLDRIDQIKIYKTRVVKSFKSFTTEAKEPREPFATISHNDCWINNTMIKMERGKPVDSKIVDYQRCSYGSPAKDLIFFLFTNVQNHVLQKHFDALVKYYHQTFVSILQELQCETTRFSLHALSKEIDIEAKDFEFIHIVLMTFTVFAPKGTVKELSEITPEDLVQNLDSITDAQREKLILIVREFAKRNWI